MQLTYYEKRVSAINLRQLEILRVLKTKVNKGNKTLSGWVGRMTQKTPLTNWTRTQMTPMANWTRTQKATNGELNANIEGYQRWTEQEHRRLSSLVLMWTQQEHRRLPMVWTEQENGKLSTVWTQQEHRRLPTVDLIKTQKTTNSGFNKEHTRLLTVDLTITQKIDGCDSVD